jgi:asparagine synthase (glutamine-hydrolysing)
MCGIAGAIDLKESRDFTVNRLLAMTNAIQHRGPDDESFHIAPGIAIAARRLSRMAANR